MIAGMAVAMMEKLLVEGPTARMVSLHIGWRICPRDSKPTHSRDMRKMVKQMATVRSTSFHPFGYSLGSRSWWPELEVDPMAESEPGWLVNH